MKIEISWRLHDENNNDLVVVKTAYIEQQDNRIYWTIFMIEYNNQ